MELLRNEQQKSCENAKEVKTICKEKFENKNAKDKKYCNLEITTIIQVNIQESYIVYVIQNILYPNKLLNFSH